MPLHLGELLVAGLLFSGLLIAFRIGSRLGQISESDQQHLGVIQGATLGMIGLLIGFCFSGATSRFVDRQDILLNEANAIGTAWLRADLLEAAPRDQLRNLLVHYTRQRIELSEAIRASDGQRVLKELATLQAALWTTAMAGVESRPHTAVVVLPPLNDIFDLLGTRNAAVARHLPPLTLGIVCASVALCSALLGYGQSRKRRQIRLAALMVVLLIGAIIWVTIDMDFPSRGLIQISNQPLQDVLETISRPNPGG